MTNDQIDALDTFALHVMAPCGRQSVRDFARAILAAPEAAEPTNWKALAESFMASIGQISDALGIPEDEQATANGNEEILERIAELRAPTNSQAGRGAVGVFTDRQCLLLSFAIRFGVQGLEAAVDRYIGHGLKWAVEGYISEVRAALAAAGRTPE